MRSPTFIRLFTGLTVLVLASDIAFLAANYVAGRDSLHRTMQQEGDKLRSAYEVAMAMTMVNMLQLATFVASDPRVQATFLDGRRAVELEGGGPGGPRAAEARASLLSEVSERWQEMQDEFGVRQLHFHLSPGSTSFLRVHAPDRFGDRTSDVRPMIAEVIGDQVPRTGLETGRIYAGLRGVVPVGARAEDGGTVTVGVVEVGSSFAPILATLDQRLGAGIAVLLRRDYVNASMWPENVRRYLPEEVEGLGCFLEASSREDIHDLVRDPSFAPAYADRPVTIPIALGDRVYAVTRFPLFDYQAEHGKGGQTVGSVVLWADDTEAFAAFRQSQMFNLVFGLFGFLLVEVLLWVGMRLAAGRLSLELAHRTEELQQQTKRLERSNAELDRFCSVVSHDLQAPVRMVVSYLGLLERRAGQALNGEGREFLGYAVDGGQRISAMIRDLLEYSRIGRDPGMPEAVALEGVTELVLRDLGPHIAEAGATIRVERPLPVVVGHQGDLVRVFDNLLTNALKYRSPDRPPVVSISATRCCDDWLVTVEDNGAGIDPQYRERIFDFFQRAGAQPGVDGTGIGLAVVKKVVEMHGGRIWCEPAASGEGTAFRLILRPGDQAGSAAA